AGYGNQRGLELLVAAGFTPEQAIKIATSNGAAFLNERGIGQLAEGAQADIVVVRGNPSRDIADVRQVELVFKDGVAYEPERLLATTAGTLGERRLESLMTWPIGIVLGLLVARRVTRMRGRRRKGELALLTPGLS